MGRKAWLFFLFITLLLSLSACDVSKNNYDTGADDEIPHKITAASNNSNDDITSSDEDENSESSQISQITMILDKTSFDSVPKSMRINLTNNSSEDFLYGEGYLIEKLVDETWIEVPLSFSVVDRGCLLYPGKTASKKIYFHTEQYDYEPGTYRVNVEGVTAEFTVK